MKRSGRGASGSRAVLWALATLALASSAAAAPRLSSEPAELIVGEVKTATLRVEGLALGGTPRAAVSEGTIERVAAGAGGSIELGYRLPRGRHPRRVCLILWSDAGGRVEVLRLVLLGRTKLPVRTRRNSSVTVHVGERAFGPVSTGRRGRARVPVLVPPGVARASVEVVDSAGLRSKKTVRIRRRPYPQLAVAVIPARATSERVRVRVVVAAADLADGVMVEVAGSTLDVKGGPQRWEAVWQPADRPSEGEHEILVSAATGGKRQLARATVAVGPASTAPVASAKPAAQVARGPAKAAPAPARALYGVVGAGVGVWGNLGALVSPRLLLEAGVEYRLSPVVLGARLGAALSWGSQSIAEPAPLDSAESSVLLVPLSLSLSVRYPTRIVSPYLAPAFVAQVVRTRNSGAGIDEVVRYDLVAGFSIVAGASRRLGPGHLFLQGGYLFGELDVDEVNLPAGGLIVEAGYRFFL